MERGKLEEVAELWRLGRKMLMGKVGAWRNWGLERAVLCKRIQSWVWFWVWRFGFSGLVYGSVMMGKCGILLWDLGAGK